MCTTLLFQVCESLDIPLASSPSYLVAGSPPHPRVSSSPPPPPPPPNASTTTAAAVASIRPEVDAMTTSTTTTEAYESETEPLGGIPIGRSVVTAHKLSTLGAGHEYKVGVFVILYDFFRLVFY